MLSVVRAADQSAQLILEGEKIHLLMLKAVVGRSSWRWDRPLWDRY